MSTPIRSHLATSGEEFTENATAMRGLAEEVRHLHDQVLAGGGSQYVERHRARGKMMVRERLEALVDPGTPVLELCPLAGRTPATRSAAASSWRWPRCRTPSAW